MFIPVLILQEAQVKMTFLYTVSRQYIVNAIEIFLILTIRLGMRGRELISSVGKIMLQGGGTFGVFMSVGTAIRCWGDVIIDRQTILNNTANIGFGLWTMDIWSVGVGPNA